MRLSYILAQLFGTFPNQSDIESTAYTMSFYFVVLRTKNGSMHEMVRMSITCQIRRNSPSPPVKVPTCMSLALLHVARKTTNSRRVVAFVRSLVKDVALSSSSWPSTRALGSHRSLRRTCFKSSEPCWSAWTMTFHCPMRTP